MNRLTGWLPTWPGLVNRHMDCLAVWLTDRLSSWLIETDSWWTDWLTDRWTDRLTNYGKTPENSGKPGHQAEGQHILRIPQQAFVKTPLAACHQWDTGKWGRGGGKEGLMETRCTADLLQWGDSGGGPDLAANTRTFLVGTLQKGRKEPRGLGRGAPSPEHAGPHLGFQKEEPHPSPYYILYVVDI